MQALLLVVSPPPPLPPPPPPQLRAESEAHAARAAALQAEGEAAVGRFKALLAQYRESFGELLQLEVRAFWVWCVVTWFGVIRTIQSCGAPGARQAQCFGCPADSYRKAPPARLTPLPHQVKQAEAESLALNSM